MVLRRPVCLSIGTSDCSGSVGIQADLKTFAAFGCHGASVLVAAQAQSLTTIRASHLLPDDFIRAQLDAVAADLRLAAIKVGLCPAPGAIRTVGRWLRERPAVPLVVDPVIADSRGLPLLHPEAIEAVRRELLPRATLLTPNRFQAALLAGMEECVGQEAMEEAARLVFQRYGCPVLVHGGGLPGESRDIFVGIDGLRHVDGPNHLGRRVRGRGCTYSAAIAASLARGESLRESLQAARSYLAAAAAESLVQADEPTPLWHQVSPDATVLGNA